MAAGGLVLGVGSALVAASWTDQVVGSTEFASGDRFGIESSVDGGSTWSSHPVGAPNPLTFTTAATGVTPGSVIYAPVRIRTEQGSVGASVLLEGASFSGTGVGTLSTALRYRVIRGATSCDATAFGSTPTFVVGAAGAVPLDTPASGAFQLPAGSTSNEPGPGVPLCFEVSLPATNDNWTNPALQNKTVIANWPFVGTS